MQCRYRKKAPSKLIRGSATSDDKFAYLTSNGSSIVHEYELSTENWRKLPSCPFRDSGLVVIDCEITTVGGYDGHHFTNELFTLQQQKWVNKYPPMSIPRCRPAVASAYDGTYHIVIGGYVGGGSWTATVELFQVQSRRWYRLTDLPHPLPAPSGTVCGDTIHAIGNDANGYSCSLQNLLFGDTTAHLICWKTLPPLPLTDSTAATLYGQLVIIGGWRNAAAVNTIHELVDDEWAKIGSMACGRSWCLAVCPSPHNIIIVGGVGALENDVEECLALL